MQRSGILDFLQEREADPDDEEHASVGVTHEIELCLGVFRGEYVLLNRS